jgi:hypothetical protein
VLTLTPAYGRDYKSRMAVLLDLTANKDFIIADASHLWDGKPINLSQIREEGHTSVRIRYAGLRKVATVDVSKNIE